MIKLAREKSLRVEDVMTRDLVLLQADTPLLEAATLLAERRIGGAPVVSARGKPLGLVSRSDLFDPRRDTLGGTVESVMTRLLYAVHPHDSLSSAVGLMVSEKIHRVVVVDLEGALVGIVTSMDVMRAMVEAEPQSHALEWVKIR